MRQCYPDLSWVIQVPRWNCWNTQFEQPGKWPLLDKMSTGMFSFQGDYRRRTQINLGRTTHEDRATLLRKAQEERRAREEKRRMEIAASKIQVPLIIFSSQGHIDSQAFWRGRQEVALTKNQLRSEWDSLVSKGGALSDAWLKAIRLFPFFYDRDLDAQRGILLLRRLVWRKTEVDDWLQQEPNFPWILTRVVAILLRSVGSLGTLSEYCELWYPANVVVISIC